MPVVSVDEDKCTGCEECADNCPADVFVMADGKSTVNEDAECVDCGTCIEVCEAEAITLT